MLKIYLKEKNEADALAYQFVVLVIAVSRESNLLKVNQTPVQKN